MDREYDESPMKRPRRLYPAFNIELFTWLSGLVFLAWISPEGDGHFSLCILKNLGVPYCPGCGLGGSISFLLHGEILTSIHTHPLGIFALAILSHRIFQLSRSLLFTRPTQL